MADCVLPCQDLRLCEQRDAVSTGHPITVCSSPKGVQENTQTPFAKWWGALLLDRGGLFLRCQSDWQESGGMEKLNLLPSQITENQLRNPLGDVVVLTRK